ncbi:hypothetical protein [Rubripirellula obstinata]|nr:hypothetical protein [Rubripirellula obstinata]
MIVGCEGCRRDDAEERKKQLEKDEAPKQDFTARPPQPFPADGNQSGNAIKPGHWTSASQTLQSNKVDARGELTSVCGSRGISLRSGLETRSVGSVPSIRPIVMPKGQRRRFDYRLLPPIPTGAEQKTCFLTSQFSSAGQSVFFDAGSQPFRMMRSQEYFFVILTERPERFAKLKQGDWVRHYYDQDAFELDPLSTDLINYRIVIPPTDDVLPIPETMLDWTSTAVVLWDDLSADALTPDQMTAMSDWIQFGGRLVVNGAAGSDQVANTVLGSWLPLKPTSNIELDSEAAVELLSGWQVKSDRSTEKQTALVRSQSGRVAVDGTLASDAEPLPESGKLVLTRRIGRGQITQPRFDITSDWIADWNSYDSFINAGILGRPKRTYVRESDSEPIRQLYSNSVQENARGSATAATNSGLRIFSRDASLKKTPKNEQQLREPFAISPITGLSGWTDNSDLVKSFRDVLRSESGIEIPKSSLVVRSLGIYLFLLVPVNYLVFRLLGRLEYAWLAVPVIAIAGAIWVARAARLDIGFARSQTEIAMLELQPGYQRGHLTRVIAIYNSLSSTYDANFKTIDGCGVPIDVVSSGNRKQMDAPDGTTFRSSYDEGPTLAGVAIDSNQIRLIHAEQMIDIGGGISLRQTQGETDSELLVNDSSIDLLDAYLVRKDDDGRTQIANLGGCVGGSTTKPRFRPADSVSVSSDLPMQTASLIQQLASPGIIANGTTRLVGRVDGPIGGFSIEPTTNQQLAQTIVLVNLKHATLPKSEVDENLLSEFRKVTTLKDESP